MGQQKPTEARVIATSPIPAPVPMEVLTGNDIGHPLHILPPHLISFLGVNSDLYLDAGLQHMISWDSSLDSIASHSPVLGPVPTMLLPDELRHLPSIQFKF